MFFRKFRKHRYIKVAPIMQFKIYAVCVCLVALSACRTSSTGAESYDFSRDVQIIERQIAAGDELRGPRLLIQFPKRYDIYLDHWIYINGHDFPPGYLFAFAAREQKAGRLEKSTFWYLVARGRYLYDVKRCRDKTVANRLRTVIGPQFAPTIKFMQKNASISINIGQQALKWDRESPVHTKLPVDECKRGINGWTKRDFSKAKPDTRPLPSSVVPIKQYVVPLPPGGADEWLLPAHRYPQIRQDALKAMENAIAGLSKYK